MIQYSTQFARMPGVVYTSTTQKFSDSAAVAMLKQISTKKDQKIKRSNLERKKKKRIDRDVATSQKQKQKRKNKKKN